MASIKDFDKLNVFQKLARSRDRVKFEKERGRLLKKIARKQRI